MTIPQEIEKLLTKGENDRIEFKTTFNTEVIETLVAFSNTHGGKVLSRPLIQVGIIISTISLLLMIFLLKKCNLPLRNSICQETELLKTR